MRVGCPKEIKNHEYRVGLTPGAVREYVAHGHEVLVETVRRLCGLDLRRCPKCAHRAMQLGAAPLPRGPPC